MTEQPITPARPAGAPEPVGFLDGAAGLTILPVAGMGEVRPGDDLAVLITSAAPWLADGDILVVTSKIVSKSEGQLVEVPLDEPGRDAAREVALRAETSRVVARRGATQIVQTHHGFVLASAGIDASNVEPTHLVLLPKDPDASARWLRDALRERFGLHVAVVVTDTMGRPWRLGLTDVAVGAAGVDPLHDYRGVHDAYGNELQLTQTAVVDELAAAADLVKGKIGKVPVAVVRGLPIRSATDGHGPGAAALVRGADADLFSMGTAEAVAKGLRLAAELGAAPPLQPPALQFQPLQFPTQQFPTQPNGTLDRADADRADANRADADRADANRADANQTLADQTRADQLRAEGSAPRSVTVAPPSEGGGAHEQWLLVWAPAGDLQAALRAGMEVQRMRARLAAAGTATTWSPVGPAGDAGDAAESAAASAAVVPEGGVPLGVLVVGRGNLPSL